MTEYKRKEEEKKKKNQKKKTHSQTKYNLPCLRGQHPYARQMPSLLSLKDDFSPYRTPPSSPPRIGDQKKFKPTKRRSTARPGTEEDEPMSQLVVLRTSPMIPVPRITFFKKRVRSTLPMELRSTQLLLLYLCSDHAKEFTPSLHCSQSPTNGSSQLFFFLKKSYRWLFNCDASITILIIFILVREEQLVQNTRRNISFFPERKVSLKRMLSLVFCKTHETQSCFYTPMFAPNLLNR